MPEILTESFCERCGTRYTFESVAPRKTRRLGQFKTLSKGVKNWVMSDDSSLDEALAAARSDEEREVTAQQLDAFHSTFNFCMNCRQYTCANCWNPVEGRCLTCAPNLGQEVLPAPFPDAAAFEPVRIDLEAWPEVDLAGPASAAVDVAGLPATPGNGFHPEELAEPSNGTTHEPLPDIDAAARLSFLSNTGETDGSAPESPSDAGASDGSADAPAVEAWPDDPTADAALAATTDVLSASEPGTDATGGEVSTVDADSGQAEAAASDDTDRRAAQLASRTSALLGRFRPGQSLDAEIAAYEARLEAEEALVALEAEGVAAAVASPVEAAERATTDVPEDAASPAPAEPEAEHVAATAAAAQTPEIEAEPVMTQAVEAAAAAEPEPVEPTVGTEDVPESAAAAAEVSPVPAPVRDDVVEQPTWRIFAPDPSVAQPGTPGPAPAGTPIQASADPQWPARPDLEESPSMALFANRDRVSSDALWAASAREVLGGPVGPAPAPTAGIQPCSNCGLSLSANARFCRRCGTRQG